MQATNCPYCGGSAHTTVEVEQLCRGWHGPWIIATTYTEEQAIELWQWCSWTPNGLANDAEVWRRLYRTYGAQRAFQGVCHPMIQ